MALLDQQTVLWDNVALSSSGYSTNSYDCGAIPSAPVSPNGAALDPSVGEPLAMVIFVTVAATVNGTQTYQWEITESASTTPSSSPTTLVTVAFTTTQAATILAAGGVVVIPIPPGSITQRYISGHFTGANTPSISITAAILPMRDVTIQKYYSSAIVVQ